VIFISFAAPLERETLGCLWWSAAEETILVKTQTIFKNVRDISAHFSQARSERQRRRELVQADFDQLREAGFLLTVVPTDQGGTWESVARSTRPICETLRTLAHGDSSVALVCAMHPGVIVSAGWLTIPVAPLSFREAWEAQRRWVFQTAREGHWWGTIASEPGSGGDVSKTQTIARPGSRPGQYSITGQKHFGSGSGITSFMHTAALVEGQKQPDPFFLDMRGVPWDGTAGVTLLAKWDGYGMIATQSHAMSFQDFPATRFAWPDAHRKAPQAAGEALACLFTSVIVGVVETALETAQRQLTRKRPSMRAYEQVEWARIAMEAWLIHQAYEGMLRSVEEERNSVYHALLGKTAIAEMAESVLLKICKVLGGGSYSRHSPFGAWLEDVRALGFLRPPWGLAYDSVYALSWETSSSELGAAS